MPGYVVSSLRCLKGACLAGLSPASYMDPEPTVGELPEPASQPQRLRVLIADDERDTLVTLGLLCRDEGMEVRLVKWGEQVPAAVAQVGPDVVQLGHAMPDRGRLHIAEELI